MAEFVDEFPKGMEANFVWGGNNEGVGDLFVHLRLLENGSVESISCWKLSPEELEEVTRTGRIYLHVFGHHPAVYVGGKEPFMQPGDASFEADRKKDK